MRWSRALVLVLLAVAVAACGGSPAASTGGGDGGDGGDGGGSSQAASAPPAASQAAPSQGSGGGTLGSLDDYIDALTPPNSTEISRTTAQGGAFLGWTSSDSPDSLKAFYEQAIANTGMQIFSTSTTSGTYSWIFVESEGSSNGGSVTVGPANDGTNASSIILTITIEE